MTYVRKKSLPTRCEEENSVQRGIIERPRVSEFRKLNFEKRVLVVVIVTLDLILQRDYPYPDLCDINKSLIVCKIFNIERESYIFYRLIFESQL